MKPSAKNFSTILIIAGVLLCVLSCSLFRRNNVAVDTNSSNSTNSNSASPAPTYDSAKFKELLDKKAELAALTPPLKLDPKAVIKGKVFVAGNYKSSEDDKIQNGISRDRRASNLAELETLIQVNCAKGKFLGNYEQGVKGYAVDCKVSLIDYHGPTIIAQKSFSNSEVREAIRKSETKDGEYLLPNPVGDIAEYINSFKVDKPMTGSALDEKEMLRLPTTVNLDPNPTLKGKLMFSRISFTAEINPVLSQSFSGLGLNYDFPSNKLTTKPEELETLVKIVCGKGTLIGKTGNTTQYSNKCEVSLIDYKTLTVFGQKTIENKTPDEDALKQELPIGWVVKIPDDEIKAYLKSLPTSGS